MSRAADYDRIAPRFDRRYLESDYCGIEASLLEFVGPGDLDLLEVGCGTGHWLSLIADSRGLRAGIDPSAGMLARARSVAARAALARARAEALPYVDGSFDRVFCVNAFHHFAQKARFIREARRVLRSHGRVMILGLDPHAEPHDWWVYEHFPGTLARDRSRYPASAQIRAALSEVGFVRCRTHVAEYISEEVGFEEAERRGLLDKDFTSQLSILTDLEYDAGQCRLRSLNVALRTDLALYATVGQVD